MKVWTITWVIMAAVCLIAVLTGAPHHLMTFGISLAMCLAFHTVENEDEEDNA